MKICSRCDKIYADNYNVCSDCRLPLGRVEENQLDELLDQKNSMRAHLDLEAKEIEKTIKPIKETIVREGFVLSGFALIFLFGSLISGVGYSNYIASGIGSLIVLASLGGYILYIFLYLFVRIIRLSEKR